MTDWADHLKKFKKKNPDVSHVEALKQAKETYKPKGKGKSSEPKAKDNNLHLPRGLRPRNVSKANRLARDIAVKETMLDVQKKLPRDMRRPILKVIDPGARKINLEVKQKERKLNELEELVDDVPEEAKGMNANQLRRLIAVIQEED